MFKKYESLDELKRIIYLWIIPFVLLALILSNLADLNSQYLIVSRLLMVWFVLNWFLVYKKRFVRILEMSNLVLTSFVHIGAVYDSIFHYLIPFKEHGIGVSIIWTPLIFIYFFLTLKSKAGLMFSLSVFLVTLILGIFSVDQLTNKQVIDVSQYFVGNFVYIVVLYFARYIQKVHMELESVKKISLIDSLTEVANRLQIDQWLENKIEEAAPFSVIFFDLDHFKRVNDQFGHKAGDSVLKEMADLVKNRISSNDCFGRWGGEEFIIITNHSRTCARDLAEDLRKKISQHLFAIAGKQTASFGVTAYRPGESVDVLLNRADAGLYESKDKGRNHVTVL